MKFYLFDNSGQIFGPKGLKFCGVVIRKVGEDQSKPCLRDCFSKKEKKKVLVVTL